LSTFVKNHFPIKSTFRSTGKRVPGVGRSPFKNHDLLPDRSSSFVGIFPLPLTHGAAHHSPQQSRRRPSEDLPTSPRHRFSRRDQRRHPQFASPAPLRPTEVNAGAANQKRHRRRRWHSFLSFTRSIFSSPSLQPSRAGSGTAVCTVAVPRPLGLSVGIRRRFSPPEFYFRLVAIWCFVCDDFCSKKTLSLLGSRSALLFEFGYVSGVGTENLLKSISKLVLFFTAAITFRKFTS